jgi:hypothetical protein
MMMKNNNVRRLAWYYILVLLVAGGMFFANFTGWRIFSFNSQQTWGASGPGGYHK